MTRRRSTPVRRSLGFGKRPALVLLAASALMAGCGGAGDDSVHAPGLPASPAPIPMAAANQPPTIGADLPGAAQVGQAFSFTPRAADADGDTLRFSASGLPAWATIDEGSGTIGGTPGAADLGSSSVVISVSDGKDMVSLPAFPLAVAPPALDLSSIAVNGTRLATQIGSGAAAVVDLAGTVELSPCGFVTRLSNAQLRAEFDADGKLARLAGTTDLPDKVSPFFSAQTGIKAMVGLYKGSEINENKDDFDVELKPDLRYLVYFLASAPEIEIGDRKNPTRLTRYTLELPLEHKRVVISDPCDVMSYRYNGTPAGDIGYGESDRGLLPFTPGEAYAQLDRFDGHRLQQGKFSLGIKAFDMFSIEGTMITRTPTFDDVDLDNPLGSTLQYKIGLNGKADFAFSVFGVGFFDFRGASTSATLDVGTSRAHMAMQATVNPDVSWQPSWFPILPTTKVVGRWTVDADGRFEAQLSGDYRSALPQGHMRGLMRVDNGGAVLEAAIPDDKFPLSVRASFRDQVTTVQIDTPRVDLGFGVQQAVMASLDRDLAKARQAFDALRSANASYEFEASLRGLRMALPAIVDTAVGVLDAVPGRVRDAVDSAIVGTLRSRCTGSGIFKLCASDFVNETSIGDSKGAAARSISASTISTPRARLLELKRVALLGDDASLRQALIDLLEAVYAARTVTVVVPKYTVSAGPFGSITIYPGRSLTYTVLSPTTAEQIRTAALHAPQIQETSDRRIAAQQVFDAMPTQQAIEKARSDVQQGLAQIPSFDGAGYEVAGGRTYTPYLILSGQRHGVSFNLLDPVEALAGIGDTISRLLTQS